MAKKKSMGRKRRFMKELMPTPNTLSVHVLEQEKYRKLLKQADIIFASDVMDSNKQSIMYGKDKLEQIVGMSHGQRLSVLNFELDFETSELEYLFAAIEVLKGEGSCCYNQ